ncbi:hypothetical protein BD408DRAFT_324061, partial [Parasitella parasitica]
CIYCQFTSTGPFLDIAQDTFRECRSSLDQALCLTELCTILRRYHNCYPTLAFLDTVSNQPMTKSIVLYIWRKLQPYISPVLVGILQNLSDEVQIEVLLSNTVS